MATEVQRILEDLVPELEDLLERGLMSHDEVQALVTKRRDFETRLQRFDVTIQDYLHYIEYELAVDKLVQKRKDRLKVKRIGPADSASTKRVCLIFDRGLKKFKSDLDLWVAAVEFAQVRGMDNRVSKLLGSAIKLFPTNEDFWILAAAHEFEKNKNVEAARSLFLQGIRNIKDSSSLWLEYFKMEYLFIQQVVLRADMLQMNKDSKLESLIVLLQTIIKRAIETRPDDAKLQLRFLQILEAAKDQELATLRDPLRDHLLSRMESVSDVGVVLECMKRRIGTAKHLEEYLREMCLKHNHPDIWEFSIGSLVAVGRRAESIMLCEEAFAKGKLTEKAALIWVIAIEQTATSTGTKRQRILKPDLPGEELVGRLLAHFPASFELWKRRCEAMPEENITAALSVRPEESLPFWDYVISKDISKLVDLSKYIGTRVEGREVLDTLVVKFSLLSQSPSRVLLDLESRAINIISRATFLMLLDDSHLGMSERRKILEMAVERYREDEGLWKRYIALERTTGNAPSLRKLILRALSHAPDLRIEKL